MQSDKMPPGKQLDNCPVFVPDATLPPASVVVPSAIHAALKQDTLFEGSSGADAAGAPTLFYLGLVIYLGLVTSFVHTKEVTRRSGETGNCKTRRSVRKQTTADFDEIFRLTKLFDCPLAILESV